MKNAVHSPEAEGARSHMTGGGPSQRVFLSAFAVHLGGGLVLLKALVGGLGGRLEEALLDARVRDDIQVDAGVRVRHVRRSLLARWAGLMGMAARTRPGDVLFCFNSLPPLRKPPGRVVNYVHAPYIVGRDPQVRYPWPSALRQAIERLWFRAGVRNCDEVWVQTPTMAVAMREAYPGLTVRVIPFVDDELAAALRAQGGPDGEAAGNAHYAQHSFFYPADGVAHKNHPNLLKAWALLARSGRLPKLYLTLRPEEMDAAWRAAGLRQGDFPSVENLGRLPRQQVLDRIGRSSALMFPSRSETLGLPMLEARALGVPILASERDFVRDVCEPVQAFDPNSPASIALAVRRFVHGRVPVAGRYYSAREVVDKLLAPAPSKP